MNIKIREFLFLLKYYFYKREALEIYNRAVENLKLSKKSINEINWLKRKRIIEHAYNNSIFYKSFYDKNNFKPSDLVTEKDWEKVPCLTKDLIKENFELILSKDINKKRIRRSTTGGSTGKPLEVFHDLSFPSEIIGWRLIKNIWGINLGYNIAMIWRVPKSLIGILSKIIYKLLWWPTRRILLDASNLNEYNIGKFIKKFNKVKPEILMGYVGAIDELAHFSDKKSIKIHPPKLVWLTSSPSTVSQQSFYANVFKANVMDQYGSCEVFWIGASCPKDANIHIFSDFRHIDILDKNDKNVRDNELGEIAVTDLENFVFPIIKYKLGDMSRYIAGSCKCGLPFPIIESVKGRVTDNLYTPYGGVITGEYITTIFDAYVGKIQNFKVYQFQNYDIKILYVLSPNVNYLEEKSILSNVENELRKRISGIVKIEFERKEVIMHDRGKTRFVISEISKNKTNDSTANKYSSK